jgi:CheY-like chemotaxis protein
MSTVLFIEDDELMSEMYSLVLREPEFTTEVVKNGKEGIARAAAWHPDIILLDMMMPTMNGLEVLDALKSDPATASIPTAMLSNLDDETFKRQAKEKGAVGYFIKSDFTGREIKVKINDILGIPPKE